jgi:arsenical pump membrane protein
VVGAIVLIAFGFLPLSNAIAEAAKGLDVYLFLIGMMLLAEVGRQEGLFDWPARSRFAIREVQRGDYSYSSTPLARLSRCSYPMMRQQSC